MNLSSFYSTLLTNFSAADRIFDIMDIEPDLTSDKNAPLMPKIEGLVSFNNVSFCYDANTQVLTNVNFTVQPGESVALVGPTGAGKTTIVSLLSRFYDPNKGEILVDNINIKNIDLASYRSQLVLCFKIHFCSDTIIGKYSLWQTRCNR